MSWNKHRSEITAQPKFNITRKWNNVNGYQNPHYIVGNEIIYSAEVLKSNLCDFNDA